MFAPRYFAPRYFAPHYWAQGLIIPPTTDTTGFPVETAQELPDLAVSFAPAILSAGEFHPMSEWVQELLPLASKPTALVMTGDVLPL